jgi:hypothetical protein
MIFKKSGRYMMKKLAYRMNNLINRGPRALMILLLLMTLVVVFFLGTIAFMIREDGQGYGLTVWYTFNHVVDPGYLFGQGDESIGFLIVMTIATFLGHPRLLPCHLICFHCIIKKIRGFTTW